MGEYSWNVITEEDYFNYEGNHVMFPMLLIFMYQNTKSIQYWNAAFFTFSLVAIWEVVEVLFKLLFTSFILFGPDNHFEETVVDIVILDLGNGIIGICIGLLVLASLKPKFKETKWWLRVILFTVYGATYSALSPFGWCREGSCDTLHFPYGNIINYFVILAFGYALYKLYVEKRLVYAFMFNAFLLNSATLIRFQSAAIMVYITSACLILGWSVYYFIANRKKRTDFKPLSSEIM